MIRVHLSPPDVRALEDRMASLRAVAASDRLAPEELPDLTR